MGCPDAINGRQAYYQGNLEEGDGESDETDRVSLPLHAHLVFIAAFVGERGYLLNRGGGRYGMKICINLLGAYRDSLEEQRLPVHLHIHAAHFPTARADFLLFHVKSAAFIEMPQQATCEFDFTI